MQMKDSTWLLLDFYRARDLPNSSDLSGLGLFGNIFERTVYEQRLRRAIVFPIRLER